ncbi:hypothetical protein PCA31118_05352 [Pandoraea captiosa]|uniref:Uncharacterized protein n=1 Tax=Pandoraea captiosa TaxID=2508302 RepID=A0A5E5AUB8_9BURK|nr:hypothetical protein [Pandoraea captiosa]VVE76994.1 hypothetical protein PCA31118_05352 [Pandoraea captiosa]
MQNTFKSTLSAAFAGSDIPLCIELLRTWLMAAEAGEPEALIREMHPALRPKVVLLMRDLLSCYPETVLGAPVLLLARPDSNACRKQMPDYSLPLPDDDAEQPCSNLRFLGWLPMDTLLPVAFPFWPLQYPVTVPWFKPTAAIALFRGHANAFECDAIEVANWWWAELFRPIAGNVRLASRALLPYPDALEAARVLQASANAELPSKQGHFLSDAAWNWAHGEGVLFHETYRHIYSGDI